MKRRSVQIVSLLLAIGLVALLWYDLTSYIGGRAERRYQAGDFAGARDGWQLALKLRNRDLTSRFNRGAAHYKLGDFAAARNDFSEASTSPDPRLRHQALFNQGNSLVRLAEQAATKDKTAADSFYRTALESYRAALALRPVDQDTQHNLTAAAAARTALLADQAVRTPYVKRAAPRQQSGNADSADKRVGEKSDANVAGKSGQATQKDQAGVGNRRRTMGRELAERLLNEKRGQGALPSAIPALAGGKPAVPPEKDW